jgi:hypothetical protein
MKTGIAVDRSHIISDILSGGVGGWGGGWGGVLQTNTCGYLLIQMPTYPWYPPCESTGGGLPSYRIAASGS